MSQYTFTSNKKAVMKLVNKNRPFYLGLREEHIAQAVWSKTGKKNLPLGITHAMAALRWAVDSHHSSHEPAEMREQLRRCHTVKCNVLCCSTILKYCSVTTELLCAGADVLLFSQISSIASLSWRQLTAARSSYEGPKTSKTFLTSYRGIRKTFSTGFTVNPPTLRSHHILITHPIMCWAIASFRDIDGTIERCHTLSIAKLSTLEHLLKWPVRFTLTNCTEKGNNTQSCVFCQRSEHFWTLQVGGKALPLSIFGVRILLFS